MIPALVDPTLKLGNYAVTSINGVLTINPSPLTFTVANASRVYGNSNPAFTGTFVGLKNGDVLNVTFTSADITSSVGTYPIVPVVSGAKAIDYSVVVKGGVLTITPAPLSVTGPSGSRLYGDPNPSSTITGLKNSDNITATIASQQRPASLGPMSRYQSLLIPQASWAITPLPARMARLLSTKRLCR